MMKYKLYDIKYLLTIFLLKIVRFFIRTCLTANKINSRITVYAGSSSSFGKKEIVDFICKEFSDKNIKILDVGPGNGIYNKLLKNKGYMNFDAVESYKPYIDKFNLTDLYSNVYHTNVTKFNYNFYNLIIFGDVLEHLSIKKAKRVISFAQSHCELIIVSIPYCNYQIGQQLDGSGDHKQFDLTRDVFLQRYSGLQMLIDNEFIGVFYWRSKQNSNIQDKN
jgi:hypothetical protein